MKTSFNGTFVIHWDQTFVDGVAAAPVADLMPGYPWSWTGTAKRVDGPESVLPLSASPEETALRRRAADASRRFLGYDYDPPDMAEFDADDPIFGKFFVLTDGRQTWHVFVLPKGQGRKPLLMFHGNIPPRETTLWIVKHNLDEAVLREADPASKPVICFTPGTMITTPDGPRDIITLSAGDRVQTKDNGSAEILWIGFQHFSGARLRAMPHLRPVRLKAGALDKDVPDDGLLVSPDHRIVLTGERAKLLFNSDEVLVTAKDLIDDSSIIRDHSVTDVSYIHMLLEHHEIVFANGVATESFHPSYASLESLTPHEQDQLFAQLPDLQGDRSSYGGFARPLLGTSDAALLRFDA